MKFLFRFLRCAALMVMMMTSILTARAQFTLTTPDDVTNHTEKLYWIESNGAAGFYAIPHTNNSNVSTTNMPNLKALWYFMDAGSENDTQYYYIVNHNTGYYLKHEGTLGNENTIKIESFGSGGDAFKFSVGDSAGQWVIYPKSGNGNYWVNKKSGNVSYDRYLKSSNYNDSPDENSKWNFVARNSVTWAQPFINTTSEEYHYYNIHNATEYGSEYYMSIDNDSDPYATVSNIDDNKKVWYFVEADSDNTISNLKYYYIVNAVTGKYLKFTGTANGSAQENSLRLYEHDGTETGDTENRFQFMVLNAKGEAYSAYAIMPKLEISYYYNKSASLSPQKTYGNPLDNDMKISIYNDRGQNINYAHWLFEETEFYIVEAPTITNNYDGTISLSTTTPGATIYYTTNGDTPDNTSTEYSSPFSLGDATVIKAIAYLGSDCSDVSIYNVPTYYKPTISYDNSTSEVTITCTGATGIYYTTDGSTPTTSSTPYSAPFAVSSGVTINAIATHPGYLVSDVATKYIQGNDYSHNYLTFNVLTDGTICWKALGSGATKTIEYSINGGAWTSITSTSAGVTFDVNEDDVVRFRGNNTTYCQSNKSNYSGFEGGTATFNIEGNIMSLTAGDNFANVTTLPAQWVFCSLFKNSLVISAENLILPATTLTADCYRAMFSLCETLRNAPALPATTLATECYWYMFECCAITKAPDLLATNLVSKCYGHMFVGCSNLNYIKCLATSGINNTNLEKWVGKKNAETTLGVAATGVFIKDENASWSSATGTSGIPTGWDLIAAPSISCDGEYITITCATEGASIYYRLNQTGDFSLYSSPIAFNSDTTVEAYSSKDDHTSYTVIITFEKYDNPFDESNRSLNSWTYGNTQVTLPYSVNGIDGHSSNYSKGNFTFETTINLYSLNPTYLWFQHADQSADIYVDDEFVTTHWGGYNAFFVDISNYVHVGTNRIKVVLNNTTRNTLAPAAGDFNFNATLGKAKLLTSPVMPSMDYGYDGFHVTATNVSNSSATVTVKTKIPVGASVVCTISDGTYNWTDTQNSTGNELAFTTTIQNPHLWNGTIDPHLYNIKLEIYKDNELYHRYERPYGLRFYAYNTSTGFILNGQPYSLRGVCMHHDLEGKANALTDSDIANDFAIIQELGCNFIRLAHYPHPKEVYDWCDRLGIIVQTEVPCVNKFQNTLPQDYYDHLYIQYEDMVRQHYNHPCIMFWGLFNEATTDDVSIAKTRLEAYKTYIKNIDPERWVGYVVSHSYSNPSSTFGNPDMDWFGCNLYVGWYIYPTTNDPTGQLNARKQNIITNLNKPLALSEYGCGGTQHCHSDNPQSTTTTGNKPRHDIEYQMWLHEGYIASIKNFPELLFTSQWQLFDIAVSSRTEGYKVCFDGGETVFDNNELKYLNNKGLVERDHKTKKDPFYLYKAWWNQTDIFVHICGKDYKKSTDRVIKCYTNDGSTLTLFVNNTEIETVSVTDNIATFTARSFNPGDVVRVDGATANDTFTFTDYNKDYVFLTEGNWDVDANWNGNAVPADGSDVVIMANTTVPSGYTANANNIDLYGGTLTIAEGGQLVSNSAVNATVEKSIIAYTVIQNQGALLSNGWYFISSPITDDYMPAGSMVENDYDLYRLNPTTTIWENYKEHTGNAAPGFHLTNGRGYLYANSELTTLSFTGALKPYAASESVGVSAGWNLIGNPFTYNVYANRSFYKMNEDLTGIEAVSAFSTSPIAPCTGILVEAETIGDVIFSKEAPTQSQGSNGTLQIALSQTNTNTRNNIMLDNAIVNFKEGAQLQKFYFGETAANIFIPQDGEDYAIALSDKQGDIPLYFNANELGTYTISFSGKDMDLKGICLIDLLEQQEINLSTNPSYTFIGSPVDMSERFKIVFRNPGDNETFAYINNGDIIITADVEGATLQVIDIMGRVIVSQDGNVSRNISTSGITPGTYVLRLINSDNVKTQKIVIR